MSRIIKVEENFNFVRLFWGQQNNYSHLRSLMGYVVHCVEKAEVEMFNMIYIYIYIIHYSSYTMWNQISSVWMSSVIRPAGL